jgi:FkbM family methyltransferase
LFGKWEEWIEPQVIGYLRPGMRFADVGANMGYYSILGAKAVGTEGKVFSFEPNPKINRILRENFFINGISAHIFDYALGSRTEEVIMRVRADQSGGGYLSNDSNSITSAGFDEYKVRMARLDDIIDAGTSIDLIKIDAEGFEPDIIRGAVSTIQRSRNIRLVIELSPSSWSGQGHNPKQFLESLVRLGFKLSLVTSDAVQDCAPSELLERAAELPYTSCFVAAR